MKTRLFLLGVILLVLIWSCSIQEPYDVVVVGSGPAGIGAALGAALLSWKWALSPTPAGAWIINERTII